MIPVESDKVNTKNYIVIEVIHIETEQFIFSFKKYWQMEPNMEPYFLELNLIVNSPHC